MVSIYLVSQQIYVAAKLGIADLLQDSLKSCSELATAKKIDESMTIFSALSSAVIAASYKFLSLLTLVDGAGGQGILIASILKSNPTLKGVLFDQPY